MNEEELRRALLTELAVPAPAPQTSLEQVLSRGRKRVTRWRVAVVAAATLSVLLVVGMANVPTVNAPWEGPLPPADAPPTGVFDWPRVDQPERVPRNTWSPGNTAPPPAGRAVVAIPQCDIDPISAADEPRRWEGSVEVQADRLASWQRATSSVLPGMDVGNVRTDHGKANPDKSGSRDSFTYSLDVKPVDGVAGSIALSVGQFDGRPVDIADKYVWSGGDCQPPFREVLPDGTVVQMHGVQAFEPFQSLAQVVRIYRADGTVYLLRLQSWGSQDLRRDPQQPEMWERIGAGRANLPISEAQLADIALTFTEL